MYKNFITGINALIGGEIASYLVNSVGGSVSKNFCQRIGICDGRILAFRHADTKADFCFIVQDNICRLIINVKPGLKLIKDLLPIVLPSSPAIANTFVTCRFSSLELGTTY